VRARHFRGKSNRRKTRHFWETLYARTGTLTRGAEPLGNLSEGCPPAIAGNSLTATVYHNAGALPAMPAALTTDWLRRASCGSP
jgi:hypothetical protein